MPGMSQGATAGNPALTLVLALFMLGYVLWATDRLASLSRARVAATAREAAAARPSRAAVTVPAAASIPDVAEADAAAYPRSIRPARARTPARRLLQDRHGYRHGLHARHHALASRSRTARPPHCPEPGRQHRAPGTSRYNERRNRAGPSTPLASGATVTPAAPMSSRGDRLQDPREWLICSQRHVQALGCCGLYFKIWSGSVKHTQILINLFNWQSDEEQELMRIHSVTTDT